MIVFTPNYTLKTKLLRANFKGQKPKNFISYSPYKAENQANQQQNKNENNPSAKNSWATATKKDFHSAENHENKRDNNSNDHKQEENSEK